MSVCGISLSSRICLHLSAFTSLGHPIGPIFFRCFLPGKPVWHFSDRSYKSTSAPCWRVDVRQEHHLLVWCWTGRGLQMLSAESIPIGKSSSWHWIQLKRSNRTLNLQRSNKFCQLRQNSKIRIKWLRMLFEPSEWPAKCPTICVLYWNVRCGIKLQPMYSISFMPRSMPVQSCKMLSFLLSKLLAPLSGQRNVETLG